jgi:hypothetical protein
VVFFVAVVFKLDVFKLVFFMVVKGLFFLAKFDVAVAIILDLSLAAYEKFTFYYFFRLFHRLNIN